MAFKLFDFECKVCSTIRESFIKVPHGEKPVRVSLMHCNKCDEPTVHEMVLSLVAPYMGEKVCNPAVRGGNYDTMGYKQGPHLPDLPAGVEHTESNYEQLFNTPEYTDAVKQRKSIQAENKEKQKRAAAIAKGENINMRNDRCAGDPKIMS